MSELTLKRTSTLNTLNSAGNGLPLEHGDKEARRLWHWFREISIERFQRFTTCWMFTLTLPRFSAPKMNDPIQLLKDKHLLKSSRGAQIVDLMPTS